MGDKRLTAEDIGRLYERHGPALVLFACGYVADRSEAEDIVQSLFHRLLRGGIELPEHAAGYLYRAVRNAALNVLRNGARAIALDESCFVHRGGDREAALALQKELRDLPEDQRDIVIMRIWGGLSLAEVASAVDVPLNTAASRYRYAVEKLRERLQPYRVKEAGKNPDEW